MNAITRAVCIVAVLALLHGAATPAPAAADLACGPFTAEPVPPPEPRRDAYGIEHWQAEKDRLAKETHRILFLGDSLTEWWDPAIWQSHYAARGAANAGIGGDGVGHLLWRLGDGALAKPAARVVVLLIGINDLDVGRSPQMTAEGIRRILVVLRSQLPQARILLLGLWPRGRSSTGPWRQPVAEVNRMIRGCADGNSIVYLDLGPALLDRGGELAPAVAPDGLHLSAEGYRRIAPPLDAALSQLEPAE